MMRIIRKLSSNFSSVEEVILFFRILLLITILPLLTRFLSVPKLMKVITPRDLKTLKIKNLDQETRIEKLVKFTNYVLSFNLWIYKNTCLKRSLVLYHSLRRSGINVRICFGVRYKNCLPDTKKKLEGHAWLLYNGDIFLESNTEITKTYKVTYCFPEVKEEVGEAIINHESI